MLLPPQRLSIAESRSPSSSLGPDTPTWRMSRRESTSDGRPSSSRPCGSAELPPEKRRNAAATTPIPSHTESRSEQQPAMAALSGRRLRSLRPRRGWLGARSHPHHLCFSVTVRLLHTAGRCTRPRSPHPPHRSLGRTRGTACAAVDAPPGRGLGPLRLPCALALTLLSGPASLVLAPQAVLLGTPALFLGCTPRRLGAAGLLLARRPLGQARLRSPQDGAPLRRVGPCREVVEVGPKPSAIGRRLRGGAARRRRVHPRTFIEDRAHGPQIDDVLRRLSSDLDRDARSSAPPARSGVGRRERRRRPSCRSHPSPRAPAHPRNPRVGRRRRAGAEAAHTTAEARRAQWTRPPR
jgi:hypothetical protein